MTVALVCVSLLGLLVFGLGLVVSITRGVTGRVAGHATDPADPLHKFVRAHGNTAEYAPMLAILMLLLGTRDPSTWTLSAMVGATLSRYLLAAGILLGPTLEKAHPLRAVGALGTYVAGFLLCGSVWRSL